MTLMEVYKEGRRIVSSSTGRNHGKQWTDGTSNDLVLHLTEHVFEQDLPSLQFFVRLGAEGNNKWRFKLTLSATLSDGRTTGKGRDRVELSRKQVGAGVVCLVREKRINDISGLFPRDGLSHVHVL
jgi:hypothetical protein